MLIKNSKLYDVLKWLVITALPAVETLIVGLGLLYHFNSEIIVGTIALVNTFIGTLIGVSAVQYHKEQNKPTSGDENGME